MDCRNCKLSTVRMRDGSYRVCCLLKKRSDLGDQGDRRPINGDPSFCTENPGLPLGPPAKFGIL